MKPQVCMGTNVVSCQLNKINQAAKGGNCRARSARPTLRGNCRARSARPTLRDNCRARSARPTLQVDSEMPRDVLSYEL